MIAIMAFWSSDVEDVDSGGLSASLQPSAYNLSFGPCTALLGGLAASFVASASLKFLWLSMRTASLGVSVSRELRLLPRPSLGGLTASLGGLSLLYFTS